MPNHYHLLIEQIQDDGIVNYLRKFQDSYAKFFNLRYERPGSLFQNRFKAVLIEDEGQLLHVSRYIHLNPYSSLIVKKTDNLFYYPWSSFLQYLRKAKGFCNPDIILGQFKSKDGYLKFIFDQADYQKNLEEIKHLTCEFPDVARGGNTRC